jgi:hypothetical protein
MGSALHQFQLPFSTVGTGLQAYHMQLEGSKHWNPFAYDSVALLQASDLHLVSKMLPQILDERNVLEKWGKVKGHPIQ